MRYNVLLHPKAADFLRKTDAKLRERIKRTLRELEESPERRGVRLSHSPFYRLRIGDYRAIYTINSEGKESYSPVHWPQRRGIRRLLKAVFIIRFLHKG